MCMVEGARADCQGGGQGALYRQHVPRHRSLDGIRERRSGAYTRQLSHNFLHRQKREIGISTKKMRGKKLT